MSSTISTNQMPVTINITGPSHAGNRVAPTSSSRKKTASATDGKVLPKQLVGYTKKGKPDMRCKVNKDNAHLKRKFAKKSKGTEPKENKGGSATKKTPQDPNTRRPTVPPTQRDSLDFADFFTPGTWTDCTGRPIESIDRFAMRQPKEAQEKADTKGDIQMAINSLGGHYVNW